MDDENGLNPSLGSSTGALSKCRVFRLKCTKVGIFRLKFPSVSIWPEGATFYENGLKSALGRRSVGRLNHAWSHFSRNNIGEAMVHKVRGSQRYRYTMWWIRIFFKLLQSTIRSNQNGEPHIRKSQSEG